MRFLIVILFLAVILLLAGLNGCTTTTVGEKKTTTIVDTIGNMDGIARALSCMFGADCSNMSENKDEEWEELEEENQ